jgi:chromosome segregation ATPase
MFMFKKIALVTGGLALFSVFCFGRDAVSYVGTSAGWLKQSVRNCVPVDFEIERARQMIKNLTPDVRNNMHVIAQEEVEVERLEKQIAKCQSEVDKQRGEILRLKNDLTSSRTTFEYGGRTYSVEQVKTDLANRFERFKTHEATLASLAKIQQARRRSLEAARQKLEGMLAAKRNLEVEVENLEARKKMVEVAQTTSDFNFDDSQLGRVRELMADVRARLNVAEKLVNADTNFRDEIPLTPGDNENIVDQVSRYLESGTAKLAESSLPGTE